MKIVKKIPIILPVIAFFDTLFLKAISIIVNEIESDFFMKLYRITTKLRFNSGVLYYNNWLLYLFGVIVLSIILACIKQYTLRQATAAIGLNAASLMVVFHLFIRWM